MYFPLTRERLEIEWQRLDRDGSGNDAVTVLPAAAETRLLQPGRIQHTDGSESFSCAIYR
jgi:hypothetical protein